jgi:hypothetical protein
MLNLEGGRQPSIWDSWAKTVSKKTSKKPSHPDIEEPPQRTPVAGERGDGGPLYPSPRPSIGS